MKTRSFIALETPPAVHRSLCERLAAWNKIPCVNWVKPENLHLTLIFLGDVEAVRMGVVDFTLHECLEDQHPFLMRLKGLELFPAHQPRLILASLESSTDAIFKLNKTLYYQLKKLAPEIGDKALKLHITLGRIKRNLPYPLEDEILQSAVDKNDYPYDTINLYRSILKPDAPVYQILNQYKLT
ncbi:MAG: RNA 2',3'-cyclic phosphodiesterase [Candidatus Cloacimonadaceae bacterium]|nr:RNA 2',3'-cyclic phosphodiesterase [Candidatus Cloacimonadaceae bacterium]MDP3113598.1 RNA 2',3'-cyclic phosphodiesterase [Candidatus Cloacimonadaceae bacterium]